MAMQGMIFLILTLLSSRKANARNAADENTDLWKACETFLAPSSVKGGGWGAFAARDFDENEIIEISPRHVYLPDEDSLIENSALNDYYYGGWRWEANQHVRTAAVALGNVMFYNHHPQPNIAWVRFGEEPTKDASKLSSIHGFVSRRKIEAGEELFSTYGEEDGGKRWFQDRKLELIDIPSYESRKNGTTFERDKNSFCSKVYAGVGRPSWENGILKSGHIPYKHKIEYLAPSDHPSAIAKVDVAAGTVLEISPALIVSLPQIFMTPVGPMGFKWDELDETQQHNLKTLRTSGDLRMQFQGLNTEWIRIDKFRHFEDVVVLPVAGNIAMVERVRKVDEANCILEIISSGSMHSTMDHGGEGSAGIALKLVATKALRSGDLLKLNIPSNASPSENKVLAKELERSGQNVPSSLEIFLSK